VRHRHVGPAVQQTTLRCGTRCLLKLGEAGPGIHAVGRQGEGCIFFPTTLCRIDARLGYSFTRLLPSRAGVRFSEPVQYARLCKVAQVGLQLQGRFSCWAGCCDFAQPPLMCGPGSAGLYFALPKDDLTRL